MVTITPTIIDSTYDNPLPNKQTAIIQFFWEAGVSGVGADENVVISAIFTNGDTGQNIQGTNKQSSRIITPTTTETSGAFITQFDIPQGDLFPSFVNIRLRFTVNGRLVGETEKDTLFTGSQGVDPLPTKALVNTFFDFNRTFKLQGGVLAGRIKAVKSSTWNDFFNNTQLQFIMQSKNNNGFIIDSQIFPFTFGNNTEFFKDIIVLDIQEDNVTVELLLFDLLNQPFSPKNTHTFTEEVLPPPNKFLVNVLAEDGFTINGTISEADFNLLTDPNTGISLFNGSITSFSSSTLDISLTFQQIMDFLSSHLIVDPPTCSIGQHLENGVCVPDDIPSSNISFQIIAENDELLAGIMSNEDFIFWSDPITGVSSLGGRINDFAGTGNVVNTTSGEIEAFLLANRLITQCPIGQHLVDGVCVDLPSEFQSTSFSVEFNNTHPTFDLRVLLDAEFLELQALLPNCATLTNIFDTPEPSQGLASVLSEISIACEMPPPNGGGNGEDGHLNIGSLGKLAIGAFVGSLIFGSLIPSDKKKKRGSK